MSQLSLNTDLTVTSDTTLGSLTISNTSSINLVGIYSSKFQKVDVVVQPYILQKVIDTSRTLTIDSTTQFQVYQPLTTNPGGFRLSYTGTGTAPGFRTHRTIGLGADSVIVVSLLSSCVAQISVSSGTALITSGIQVGDQLLFEATNDTFTSPFAPANQGILFTVRATTSSTITVQSQDTMVAELGATLGSSFATAMRVFSAGQVQLGDTLLVRGTTFSPANRGKYTITEVSDYYIGFQNACAVPETVSSVDQDIVIAESVFGLLSIASPGPVQLLIDAQVTGTFLEPVTSDLAYFVSTCDFYAVYLYQTLDVPITVQAQYCVLDQPPACGC